MNETANRELKKKAPLLEIEQLSKMIVEEIMTKDFRERAKSIWVSGSFVNPLKEIDPGDYRSDLDLFITIPKWDLPLATSSIPIFAEQAPTPTAFAQFVEAQSWERYGGNIWNCSAEEAWKTLPVYVQDTLLRGTKKCFYARDKERRRGEARNYDIVIGNLSQIKFQAHNTNAAVACIWSNGEPQLDEDEISSRM